MNATIDRWLPWLADLLELGGPVLGLILCIAALIWALLFERFYFVSHAFPKILAHARGEWRERVEHQSWFALQQKNSLVAALAAVLNENLTLISTLIKICPLLGLLGTVLGMLEVFDALAATGSNNPRSMAAGVSKATVSTLAGMVVAISGLLPHMLIERRTTAVREQLNAHFETPGTSHA